MRRYVFGATAAVALASQLPAQEPSSAAVLQPQAAGAASWAGNQVQYLFVKTDSPTSAAKAGGSSLVFVPVVSFPQENGEPALTVRDPERCCDGLWVTMSGEPKLVKTAKDVAKLVEDGLLDPKTPVDVGFELTLHDDLSAKLAVWEACQAQLKRLEEPGPAKPAAPAAPSAEDLKRAVQSVYMVPAKHLRLRCESPGLEAVTFALGNGSNLARHLPVEGRVPAGFVARLFTKTGVTMRLEFVFDAYGEAVSTASAREVVSSFAEVLLSGQGDGATTSQSGADGGGVRVLTTRDAVNRVSQVLTARRDVVVSGVSAEDINLLLTMMQQGQADLLAVSADEIQKFLTEQFDTEKALKAPGVVTAFARLGEKKTLTDEEAERFYADFASHGRRSQGGGGFSLGPVSLGGGGGSESQDTTARKEQRRDAIRKFAQDMYEYKTQGKFPVHPKLDYKIAAAQSLEKQYEQNLKLRRANKVSTRVLSARFGTARDPIRATDEDLLLMLRRRQEELERKLNPAPPPPKK